MFFKLEKGNIEHYFDFDNGRECLYYEFVRDQNIVEQELCFYEGFYKLFDDLKNGFNIVFRER